MKSAYVKSTFALATIVHERQKKRYHHRVHLRVHPRNAFESQSSLSTTSLGSRSMSGSLLSFSKISTSRSSSFLFLSLSANAKLFTSAIEVSSCAFQKWGYLFGKRFDSFPKDKKQYEGSISPTHFEVKIYSGTDNFKTSSSCLIFVYLNPYIYSEQSKKKKHNVLLSLA